MNGLFIARRVNQGLHLNREVHILQRVNSVKRIEGHGIADLTLLGILLWEGLIGYVPTEVTVVL